MAVLVSVLCGDRDPAGPDVRAEAEEHANARAAIGGGQVVVSVGFEGTEDGASGLRSVWKVELDTIGE